MSLKQKLLELKRFRVLTNEESSITKGEKIVRKDYVETVKLPDVVALLDEAKQDIIQHLINRPKYVNSDWFKWETELESKLVKWLGKQNECKR